MPSIVRFFLVVPVVPPMLLRTMGAVSVTVAVAVALGQVSAAEALVPISLLHLFTVSSGFTLAARRGHYDFVLTSGQSRWVVGMVHFAMSSAPGALAWMGIVAVDLWRDGAAGSIALATGTWAALFMMSAMAWAMTVPLPRFAGAIGWLLAMSGGAVTSSGEWDRFFAPVTGGSMSEATRVVLCPFILIGIRLAPGHLLTMVSPVLIACGILVCACIWIHRVDVPLEASQ